MTRSNNLENIEKETRLHTSSNHCHVKKIKKTPYAAIRDFNILEQTSIKRKSVQNKGHEKDQSLSNAEEKKLV